MDLAAIKKIVSETTVGAPAKMGAIAPCNVVIPAGPTGLEPTQTAFWAALNISTKILRGQIEVTHDVNLIRAGEKVGASESALLAKLNIKPFHYGLKILQIYDESGYMIRPDFDFGGSVFEKFGLGVRNVAAASLGLGFPTFAAVPYYLVNAYKNVASVAVKVPGYDADLVAIAFQPPTLAPVLILEDEPVEDEDSEDDIMFSEYLFD